MVVKVLIQVFWIITPSIPVGGYHNFWETHCLHIQSRSEFSVEVHKIQAKTIFHTSKLF